ncbi:dihydropteroate synthase [Falsihalocynthiibacter sp. SS001]|uniref:dihydropteroate synthase n=1 Tax=Falsihalocynthiibacter sp. SS001 TaxID=3349698 RepID=UPI0036D3D37E
MTYFRALPQVARPIPEGAYQLAGGWCWFDRLEVLDRSGRSEIIAAKEAPEEVLKELTGKRPRVAGMSMSEPNTMGILNVTPDSFSDGGLFDTTPSAAKQAKEMIAHGVQIVDIGGESTRPGAQEVKADQEIERVVPAIHAVRVQSDVPISIDTRKAAVAKAALNAGANLVNDVSALSYDPALAGAVADSGAPVCLMHAQGNPQTMQANPQYDNVVLDVYDYLLDRIKFAAQAGISKEKIVVDPGIGFGKTAEHNLALLHRISIFHSLGCPILLGASRKKFVGTISGEPYAKERVGGSLAIALNAYAQGVQILRVHDTKETTQALRLAQEL